MQKMLEKTKEELGEVKKESHRRKKTILAQQQMLQSGVNSYNKVALDIPVFIVDPSQVPVNVMKIVKSRESLRNMYITKKKKV